MGRHLGDRAVDVHAGILLTHDGTGKLLAHSRFGKLRIQLHRKGLAIGGYGDGGLHNGTAIVQVVPIRPDKQETTVLKLLPIDLQGDAGKLDVLTPLGLEALAVGVEVGLRHAGILNGTRFRHHGHLHGERLAVNAQPHDFQFGHDLGLP